MLEMAAGVFGSKSRRLEKVNMAGRLEELGLDMFFGSSSWPDIAPVRELATKVRSLSGEGFANPFVYVDLKKYVMRVPWCVRIASSVWSLCV